MKIPFVDLKSQYLSIKNDIDSSLSKNLEDASFIGGSSVEAFEKKFSKMHDSKYCISVGNGTDSLFIIMKMLKIGKGDEVITVSNSWISTSETISLTGAKPVFVDIHPEYYTIDVNILESKINANTKLIIPVHLYGQPCDMLSIKRISKKYNIPFIEDCAQSHFASYNNQLVGTFGIASSFSFYPGKNLGAYGDAGCILTQNLDLANSFRMFARHGALVKHNHLIEGINSRMDSMQASILNVKLKHISSWTERRIKNAHLYDKLLENVGDVIIPKKMKNVKHVYHLYVIRTKKRNQLKDFLHKKEIQTAIHYPTALPNLEAYSYLGYNRDDFPVSSAYENEIISLPMYAELDINKIEYVVKMITKFFKN